jgi:hypothetical protein
MTNLTYLRNDENVAQLAILTSSTADGSYPLANLIAMPISKPFRFLTPTSQWINLELPGALSIDCFALINTNLTSAATITINAGSVSNPDGSQYTTTLPWRQHDNFKFLSAPQTYRYWKILVSDPTNLDGYIQIGYAMLGNCTTLDFNFAYGWHLIEERVNLEQQSEFGTPHIVDLYSQNRITMEFQNRIPAETATLLALYQALKRNYTPLLLAPDGEGIDAYFCRLISNFDQTVDFYRSVNLEFLEEPRGRSISA